MRVWRYLYPRVHVGAFIALLALGQFMLSMLIFFVLGKLGQFVGLSVTLMAPVWNAYVIFQARKRD